MTTIQIAEWRPDAPELNGAYSADIRNVICADGSYIPFLKHQALSSALSDAPLGAFSAKTLAGQVTIFVGTEDALFVLNNTDLTWDDVSQNSTTYNATDVARWSFAQFGNFVIAVNANDDPQVFELGVSTEFRDLGGSPPRASFVRVWGDFVALMGLTSNLDRVQWSGLNDCEFWTPGSQNSDYQTFPDGGVVQGSTEATNPLVFQERAIRKVTFVPGSVEIFTFDKIHDQRGAKSPYSVASRGSYAFYADEGGFFQIGADGSLLPIGSEKVDRTTFGHVTSANTYQIIGAVDPFYSRVYWAVDYNDVGHYDTLLIYDWNLKRWTRADVSILLLFPAFSSGYTLEGLDTVSTNLDALPYSLDSRAWQGGAPVLSALDTNFRLAYFNGDTAEALVYTQEQGDVAGGVALVKNPYAIVDTADLFISIGSRFRRNDPFVWTPEGRPNANTGRALKKSRARFHKVKTRIPEGTVWSHIQGVDVEVMSSGMR